ncbi:AAA family ATPase [Peptococcus simiae]|uniref:AAA family ATPase n=1 Tax=Peptococcus simiae TaxID=1643805 RepID=UPI003980996E
MFLKKLELKNFQGIKDLSLDLGQTTRIYGDNATGKTTVANALSWLLFDKSSTGEKGFSPKTIGPEGEVHGLEHSVTAIFSDRTEEVELRKVFYEKYTKSRGSATEEFAGHTTDYFIDAVPQKKKDFDKFIESRFGSTERLQILTDPLFFSETLPWEKRRAILIGMSGGLSDNEVLLGMGSKVSNLRAFLEKKPLTVDELTKMLKAQKRDLAKDIEAIPARIDEANLAKPDVTLTGNEKARAAELEAEAARLRAIIAEKKAADGVASEVERLTKAIDSLRQGYVSDKARCEAELASNEKDLQLKKREAEYGKRDLLNKAQLIEKEINQLTQARQDLVLEFQAIKNEQFVHNSICPTCGQAISPEKLKEAEASFNQDRAERLETINKKGQACNKKAIEAKTLEAGKLYEEAAGLDKEMDRLDKNLSDLKAAYENELSLLAQSAEMKEVDLKEAISQIQSDAEEFAVDTSAEEAALKKALEEQEVLMSLLSQAALVEAQDRRIKELQEEQKKLSGKYEELEGLLYETEVFTRAKASALHERINSRFTSVRFVLTEEQVNGGVKDVCNVLVPRGDGVYIPFSSANNAARLNAGLGIISALSEYWGTQVPVVVDNAESVTKLATGDLQTLALYVSEDDKVLRIESEEN